MTDLRSRVERLLAEGPLPWEIDVIPHVEVATVDAIRAFAIGTGDDNALYSDPDRAAASVHGGLIAPPLFLLATGTPPDDRGRSIPGELLERLRTEVQIIGETWRWSSPVRPGDRLVRCDELVSIESTDDVPANDAMFDLVQVTSWWRGPEEVGRRTRRRRYGAPRVPRSIKHRWTYTDEQIAEIETAQLAERRRGRDTRTSKGLDVGTELPTIIRGPLTSTDLVTYRAAVGQGPMRAGVLRLRALARQQTPELFSRDRSGAWDTIERLHWDDSHAIDRGHPGAYDYSHMRTVWFSQVLTDWAGDGAWLQQLTVRGFGPNHVGDTQWISGVVISLTAEADVGTQATIQLECHDQTGRRTFSGVAQVLLPDQQGEPAPHGAFTTQEEQEP